MAEENPAAAKANRRRIWRSSQRWMQAQVLPQKVWNQKEKQELMLQSVAFARVHQL
jgi:hypothetical protein